MGDDLVGNRTQKTIFKEFKKCFLISTELPNASFPSKKKGSASAAF